MEFNQNQPIKEKLDFGQVLFKHIIQTSEQAHDGNAYTTNVAVLEALLTPYLDKDYENAVNNIGSKQKQVLESMRNKHDPINPFSDISILRADVYASHMKLKELMLLARRKGLLPPEMVSHIMGEDDGV